MAVFAVIGGPDAYAAEVTSQFGYTVQRPPYWKYLTSADIAAATSAGQFIGQFAGRDRTGAKGARDGIARDAVPAAMRGGKTDVFIGPAEGGKGSASILFVSALPEPVRVDDHTAALLERALSQRADGSGGNKKLLGCEIVAKSILRHLTYRCMSAGQRIGLTYVPYTKNRILCIFSVEKSGAAPGRAVHPALAALLEGIARSTSATAAERKGQSGGSMIVHGQWNGNEGAARV